MAHQLAIARPLWSGSLGWAVACVATVTLAAASMPVTGWASDSTHPAAVAGSAPLALIAPTTGPIAAERLNARAPERCRTCGIVETVRALDLAGDAPAGYELTVRFRDGSRRTSSHADHAGWRAGDSILLLGGASLADRT